MKKEPLKLREHQTIGVAMAKNQWKYASENGVRKCFAIYDEMGAGKTAVLVNILRHAFAEIGHVEKTLIISPLITLGNWGQEIDRFSKINSRDVLILNQKTGRKKLQAFLNAVSDPKTLQMVRNRVVVMNYECVQNADLFDALLKWKPTIVGIDEAHRIRNHKSKRAKLIRQLTDRSQHTYVMTGTPILNSAQDVFHLYQTMDGGATFGNNFYAFRNRYFQDNNAGWSTKPGYFPDFEERAESFSELNRKMYFWPDGTHKARRVLKKDCLDLPNFTRYAISVELSNEQQKMYREMRDEFITFVQELKNEGKPLAVVANLAITKALRLMQITSGFVKAEDGVEYTIKDNPRLAALKELLEDHGSGKVIVWACFKHNYIDVARVCTELKLPYTMIHGGISAKDKEANMKAFRQDPKLKVMIANQGAGGIGVNLVEAPLAITFSRDFSLEKHLQAEARNYRGGSEMHDKVTHIDLIAKNSIDELVVQALSNKQSISDKILDLEI